MSGHAVAGDSLVDRKLPPITEIGAASMVAIAGGVIYLASYLPKHAPLWGALVLLAVAAGLLLTNVVLLTRLEDFAWSTFFLAGKWALLAYLVIAGMIEYAFLYDHTRGAQLAVMTAMLALFATNVPVLIAFTVARFQRV